MSRVGLGNKCQGDRSAIARPLLLYFLLSITTILLLVLDHYRGWDKFHTPRNICLALSGEAGELCELFQWKDEDTCSAGLPGWTSEARDKVAQVIQVLFTAYTVL